VTTSVFVVGRFGLLSGQFDRRGLGTFASDGFMYQSEIVELCKTLRGQGLLAWATWPTQLHVRLYSLPVFLLSGGNLSVLTIEPLNLFYYLAIVVLIFKLGRVVFNYRTGFIAAVTVGIWPSFLLHTTQLLRDPLLIAALLLLVLMLVLSLERKFAWPRGLLFGLAAIISTVLIRIVRLPMWSLLAVVVFLAVLFLAVELIRRRLFAAGNVAFAVIVIAATLLVPRFQTSFHNQQVVNRPRMIVPEAIQALPVAEQIAARRRGFELQMDQSGEPHPSQAGSDIDGGVRLNGWFDIVRQAPRAAVVGFFAPFPSMWMTSGKQVGGGGRLLAGVETLLSYAFECLALIGLWAARKHLSAWLLFFVVTLGAVALGLVVANIGALYRLRYPFWAMLFVFSAGGVDYLLRRQSPGADVTAPLASVQPAGTFHS
jgi:hypothetical protein